ncbi:MAG: Cytochrome c2 [Steroidobacteraceae bacterium]|nr:Cytochrome c2 [Steroidobacteraceae bacterium]
MPRVLLSIAALSIALAGQAFAAGAAPTEAQLKRGKLLFTQCQACHQVKPGAPSLLGPNLSGVIGRKAATVPGFRFSPALAKSNLTWDAATLDKWLERPSKLVPGNTMAFAGLPRAEDRAAVIAWLAAETAAPKKK